MSKLLILIVLLGMTVPTVSFGVSDPRTIYAKRILRSVLDLARVLDGDQPPAVETLDPYLHSSIHELLRPGWIHDEARRDTTKKEFEALFTELAVGLSKVASPEKRVHMFDTALVIAFENGYFNIPLTGAESFVPSLASTRKVLELMHAMLKSYFQMDIDCGGALSLSPTPQTS